MKNNSNIATSSITGKQTLLSEQWVLVTGGARGLGAAIVRALVRENAGVVVDYRKSETLALARREELGPPRRLIMRSMCSRVGQAR